MKPETAIKEAIRSSSRIKQLKGGRFYCFKVETLSKICHKAVKLMNNTSNEGGDNK